MRRVCTLVAPAACLVAMVIGGAVSVAPSGAAPSSPVTATSSRSGHVAYEGCSAKSVALTVSLSARTYGLGQDVRWSVRLHNLGARTCGGGGSFLPAGPGRGLSALALGPCGSLPLTIQNDRGAQVYPQNRGLACPVLRGPSLSPHATLRAVGSWDRVVGSLRPARMPMPAPPGRYRVVVGSVAVPFTLTMSPPTAALTSSGGIVHGPRPAGLAGLATAVERGGQNSELSPHGYTRGSAARG